ncbi:fungal-specific transcription factor domain-containing protein [Aspergillus pseudonomiae]|uniref:Fungal-specific transcription factor domain-containing protein n=1 Tax=Aspergillus pseudonomiae TaxID=1506151 RepID=A0A5N7D465_9EURO|nr:fungal-specific transcription factor domain-containing protein [Aspergillus pseudonomiae]KAE8401210.1 fungal-specific transcription factor domain-containing protein [Aspergillus pseudonomiae]
MHVSGANATDGEAITNPLVSATSFYLQDTPGRYRFCGPSSTWSFSQRVFLLLKTAVPEFPAPELPFHVDGTTWELNWARTSLDSDQLLAGLPSLHDALYLLEVAKFHSYQMLFLFDEEKFLPHLHEFYQKGLEKARSSPLWFIQYLLIIALAKRTTTKSRSSSSPPGFVFFERAMSLMPDWVGLHRRRPNLGMQILYLAGLYLVSVDMKDAAYAYVGQSFRTCIIEGLQKEPPIDLFGVKFANEGRNIWWTTYILDRQLSVMVGAPCSIQDSEITCSLPSSYDASERGTLLTVHVKLSRIMGDIIKSVYTADSKQRRSFIATVQSVLRDIADILREIENVSARTAHPTLRTVSTTTNHLFLLYHQCIILATRPLFLYFLTHRLKKPRGSNGATNEFIPPPLRPLLETSLQSAKISLRTLISLHEQSSLESFIPFNQDNAFFSAFIVVLAFFIEPSLVPDVENYISTASWLLNAQIANGDLAANNGAKNLTSCSG